MIDDERPLLKGLGKLLRKEGYRVHLAADDESGLRLLRNEHVQVVLTDLRMPGLDGPAVLRHVRESRADADAEVQWVGSPNLGCSSRTATS